MADADVRFGRLVAALYDPVQTYFERVQAPPHRTYLASGLHGRVLEIGVGTGAMVPYYDDNVTDETTFHGIEPDPRMARQARKRVRGCDVDLTILPADGQSLPYADDAFDFVLECGVCCSVPDVDAMLDEVARVLAPDGEFRFLDHVRSDGVVGRSQDVLTPAWRRFGGNCHLNRRIGRTIEACEGLGVEECDRLTVGYWPVREFVRGTAVPAKK